MTQYNSLEQAQIIQELHEKQSELGLENEFLKYELNKANEENELLKFKLSKASEEIERLQKCLHERDMDQIEIQRKMENVGKFANMLYDKFREYKLKYYKEQGLR